MFARVDDLKHAIQEAGETATMAELARRWGVSRQAVKKMVDRPGFPDPLVVTPGGTAIWLVDEADAYRNR